ncbi:RecB family exonuclease [Planctellipticum variicoloris]|uniref:RecB family exonuclease n=1 Tax=Planctellipticum variicoloris TaxID=3064265 RepID=UPI0030140082|nr:PD-(D/E)XK nuclease family protein [Planctomycetaceae bacterium SH412]
MTNRPHWSYSSISQYLRCPLQYYFQRVLGLPSRSIGSGLVLGSAVHAGLAEYHRRLKEHESIDSEAILKVFHECWGEKEAGETVVYRNGESREDNREQGIQLLKLYLDEPPPDGIIAVEQRVLVPLYNSRGEYLEIPLVAIADLITATEQDLTVREFKTSGRAYSAADVESSLQPTCYVHAVRETFGRDANVEYTVLVKTKTPKVQRLRTSRYSEDCGRLGDVVQTIQRAVDLGIFYPVESPMNCATCPYRQHCRAWGQPSRATEMPELDKLEIPQEAMACSLN